MPRHAPRIEIVGLVLVLAGAAGWAASGRPEPEPPTLDPSVKATYVVVIPQANYQSIVISPKDSGVHGGATAAPVQFILRTRDVNGVVSDFPFFVRVGELHSIAFPTGWMPASAAALFAPDGATFAAWGVTAGAAAAAGGSTVRFEPIDRDPNRDTRNREREREFEEFLREAQRNK